MDQNSFCGVDRNDPMRPLYTGVFEKEVTVGGVSRKYLVYIPEGARPSTAGLFLLPENGKTAEDMFEEGTWRYIADSEETKEKLILFILEPVNGRWNTEETYGVPDGDVAYVNAVWIRGCERFQFCVHESKFYLAGFREGGQIAQKAAMDNPAVWAGIAAVGASYVEKDYTDRASRDYCTVLDGFEDPAHRKNIRKGEIPMPAFIVKDPDVEKQNGRTDMTDYWKASCGITENGHLISPSVTEYVRSAEAPYSPNQEREAFRVWDAEIPGSSENFASKYARLIWKGFLYHQRRWMSGPGGDLRVTKDPVADLHMEYHYDVIDGWRREWYVYVPQAVRDNPERPVPVVFAIHGYTCSGEIYAGNSEWYKVADRYGFIVVHPSAVPGTTDTKTQASDPGYMPLPAWNFSHALPDGPDENRFFRELLRRVGEEHAVDRTRVYVTGHSHGSLMTQVLALTETGLFAAAAPCSGVMDMAGYDVSLLPDIQNRVRMEIPVWMFAGEMEEWLLPHDLTDENSAGRSVRFWRSNNGITPEIPDDWNAGWNVYGRWHDYFCKNAEGVETVRFTWVEYMPHATMTEMSFRIWEEFFSRFSRVDGKIICRS